MNDPKLQPEQVSAIRSVLLSYGEQAPSRAPRVVRRAGFGALALGAATAVVAGVIVAIPDEAAPAPQASAMLRDAATAAVDPEPADGQYLKLETTASYLALTTADGTVDSTIGYLESQRREVYVPADARGESIEQTTLVAPTVFFGRGAEEFAERARNAAPVAAATAGRQTDSTRPVENLAAMPRDPRALLAYLREFRYQAGTSDENVFAHVVDLLRAGGLKSDLRAALYSALALMPSVTITEEQASLDGRVGTAIGLLGADGDTRQEIVIDPATGEYIGVRLVTVTGFGEIPPGTPLEYTALTATIVNSVPR
jgi:hypothetical protein